MNKAKDIFKFCNQPNTNPIAIFENKEMRIQMRIILNDDNSISVNAEDAAIGFGWVQTQNKKGKFYTSIRWETLNGYCKEFGFPNMLGKDDYIPESLFYMLGFKAGNERAQKFQRWLAMEVVPSIRKTGSYSMVGKELSMADYIKLLDVVMNCDQERFEYIASILRSMGFGSKADHKQGRKQTSTTQHHVYASNTEGRQHVEDFLAGVEITNRPTNDVYEEYNAWCDHKNITPVSKIVFSKYVNAVLGTHVIQKKLNNVNRKIFAF